MKRLNDMVRWGTAFIREGRFHASLEREEGQTLVEYALIIGLVSIALISAATFLYGGISGLFTTIGNTI